MTQQLYIVEYESSQWAGASSQCVVWAADADSAETLAGLHMEEHMRELYSSEYDRLYDEDDEEYCWYDDEPAYSVLGVELLTAQHPHMKYFLDPTQAEFYPQIGAPV